MKVVTAESMRLLELRTMEEFGITGLSLMEKAGKGCAEAIIDRFGQAPNPRAVIFAGKGNNGGDGFVIARLLGEEGWRVTAFVLARPDEIRGDARTNLDLLHDFPVLIIGD